MKNRFFPSNYDNIINDKFNIEIRYNKDSFCCIGYVGNSSKPKFHSRHKNFDDMIKYIDNFKNNVIRNLTKSLEEKEKRKKINSSLVASDFFKIGDYVYNSWGYEQTNIEFYKVIKINPKSIEVVEVCQKIKEGSGGYMSCKVSPTDEIFSNGKKYILRIKAGYKENEINICNPKSYYYFKKWSGDSKYCSWYY